MNNIFLGSVPDSEFPLLNNERFTYEFLNINGKENIKYRFNWIDKGNIWEKRIEGANKDLTDKFKWVFENAMSTDEFNMYIDMIESGKFDDGLMNKV
ncbi:MAG: hypothetical protein IPO98_16505 [Saprospiraceae bacterium]|nr:hypothetical protein [Saprospiraceae bacterium]